jgi:hypothetical protein
MRCQHTPVPARWLNAHPDLALPHLREAAAAAALMSVDDAFDYHVEGLIGTVRPLLQDR